MLVTVYTVVKRERMIPFSGLSRFSGLFDGDGPSPLNRDTTVIVRYTKYFIEAKIWSGKLRDLVLG